MDLEDKVVVHGERLASLETSMKSVKEDIGVLFDKSDNLLELANQNKIVTEKIDHDINNGIKDKLDKICKALIGDPTNPEALGIIARICALEENSWFNKFLNMSGRRIIIWIAILGAIFVAANNLTWSLLKEHFFGEKPGQVEMIANQLHYHLDKQGHPYVESHENPDGPTVRKYVPSKAPKPDQMR